MKGRLAPPDRWGRSAQAVSEWAPRKIGKQACRKLHKISCLATSFHQGLAKQPRLALFKTLGANKYSKTRKLLQPPAQSLVVGRPHSYLQTNRRRHQLSRLLIRLRILSTNAALGLSAVVMSLNALETLWQSRQLRSSNNVKTACLKTSSFVATIRGRLLSIKEGSVHGTGSLSVTSARMPRTSFRPPPEAQPSLENSVATTSIRKVTLVTFKNIKDRKKILNALQLNAKKLNRCLARKCWCLAGKIVI